MSKIIAKQQSPPSNLHDLHKLVKRCENNAGILDEPSFVWKLVRHRGLAVLNDICAGNVDETILLGANRAYESIGLIAGFELLVNGESLSGTDAPPHSHSYQEVAREVSDYGLAAHSLPLPSEPAQNG